jgi:hypothetical protein
LREQSHAISAVLVADLASTSLDDELGDHAAFYYDYYFLGAWMGVWCIEAAGMSRVSRISSELESLSGSK